MKIIKKTIKIMLMLIAMVSFSQCSSSKKTQNSAPFEIGEAYYQKWIAGVKGGGSGINIFIPIISNPNNVMLDSVYFRGKQSKIETVNKTLFIGRFKTATNTKKDIVMSSEPYAEYGNKAPSFTKKSPFKLNDDECVVSYIINNKVKYLKISNNFKKEHKIYQSAPPKKQ